MALLEIVNMSKRFGGLHALTDVSLAVERGQVHALIGPNGAGKTTLFNCISGLYRPDQGTIRFRGKDITRTPAHRIPKMGIARTFQNLELFRNATVLDNIMLGRYLHKTNGIFSELLFLPGVRRQEVAARGKVEAIIDFLDLQSYRDQVIAHLPFGIQKCVELARALALDPEVMLLDEPAAGLNPEEARDLCFWIEDIREAFNITIILVEHDMGVVNEVSKQVTVLDFGTVIAEGSPDEVQSHPAVIRAYLGEEDGTAPSP